MDETYVLRKLDNQNDLSQGGQRYADKENMCKKANPLEEYNAWFRQSKKKNDELLSVKETVCNCCHAQMLKVRKECSLEIKRLKQQYETELAQQREHYEQQLENQSQSFEEQLRSKEEEIDSVHTLLSAPKDFDTMLSTLRMQFEEELKNEREVFQYQLEKYISEKIHLETQLQLRQEEVESLVEQLVSKQRTMEQSKTISSNFASMLFRDTNRKQKIQMFHCDQDLSIVEEDYHSQGISKHIRNFNDNVKLIDKSCEHNI